MINYLEINVGKGNFYLEYLKPSQKGSLCVNTGMGNISFPQETTIFPEISTLLKSFHINELKINPLDPHLKIRIKGAKYSLECRSI